MKTHDEREIGELFREYVQRWQSGDLTSWSQLFTEDADFITWGGLWWRTREAIVAGHRLVPLSVVSQQPRYRFESWRSEPVTPTVALAHAVWHWPDFKERSDSAPEDRSGVLTMLLVRTSAGWRIRASQNTRTSAPVGAAR